MNIKVIGRLSIAMVYFVLMSGSQLLAQVDDPWETIDLDAPPTQSEAIQNGNEFEITASGNFYNSPDIGHFVYQELTGDFTIIARVSRLDSVNEWSKAGLMIRNELTAESRNALVFCSPGGWGVSMQGRSGEGGAGEWFGGATMTSHLTWIKLERTGDVIKGAYADDGASWTQVAAVTIDFDDVAYAGMAVASTVDAPVTAVFSDVTVEGGAASAVTKSGMPSEFQLGQNYPNPFNPSTRINVVLEKSGEVELNVFNLLGQPVAALMQGRYSAGRHEVEFDASALGSGIYFYQIKTENQSFTRQMILQK